MENIYNYEPSRYNKRDDGRSDGGEKRKRSGEHMIQNVIYKEESE